MSTLPLEHQLQIKIFQHYLDTNRDRAQEIALDVFQELLAVRSSYSLLQYQHQQALECLSVHAEASAAIRILLQKFPSS